MTGLLEKCATRATCCDAKLAKRRNKRQIPTFISDTYRNQRQDVRQIPPAAGTPVLYWEHMPNGRRNPEKLVAAASCYVAKLPAFVAEGLLRRSRHFAE